MLVIACNVACNASGLHGSGLHGGGVQPCCCHVAAELENHLQISEKAVAEFIIDTAKEKKDVDAFKEVSVIQSVAVM